MEQKSFVNIGTVNDKVQAQMVVDMLKQNGIFAYNEELAVTSYRTSAYRGYGMGGEAIYVGAEDVELAKELAGDFFQTENKNAELKAKFLQGQDRDARLAGNVRGTLKKRLFAIIVLFLFAALTIFSLVESMIP